MRTTVTLDDDVVTVLHVRARKQNVSFKQALNDTLRAALFPMPARAKPAKPFRTRPIRSKLRVGAESARPSQLLDELDVERFVSATGARAARFRKR